MIETLILNFLKDEAIKKAVELFLKEAGGAGGLDAARQAFMDNPAVAPFLKNPIIKKIIIDSTPEELQPVMKGLLSSGSLKELEGLSPEELQKKANEGWLDKALRVAKEIGQNIYEILDNPNTVNFMIPALVGMGLGASNVVEKSLDAPKAVKSVGASSNAKFRKVSQAKFVKVAQQTEDFMPNFNLNPNFKNDALQSYQKIISSNASDREKSIMLNYLMSNLQSEISPVLQYIKEYLPDIYSYYESNYK